MGEGRRSGQQARGMLPADRSHLELQPPCLRAGTGDGGVRCCLAPIPAPPVRSSVPTAGGGGRYARLTAAALPRPASAAASREAEAAEAARAVRSPSSAATKALPGRAPAPAPGGRHGLVPALRLRPPRSAATAGSRTLRLRASSPCPAPVRPRSLTIAHGGIFSNSLRCVGPRRRLLPGAGPGDYSEEG